MTLILAVALALRVREAMRTPLWFDEIFSLWNTRFPFGVMLHRLEDDIHPPLHGALLWLVREAGGEHPLWLKSLPIAIGLVTVAVAGYAASEMFGRRAGVLAAALLAIHRQHVYFSQEIRSYALLALATLLAVWTAWRWLERGRPRDAVGFALAGALGLYTHYLFGIVLFLLAAWSGARLLRTPGRLPGWALMFGGVTLMFLPQAPTFLHQLALSREHWMKPPTFQNLTDLSRQIAFGAQYMVPVLAAVACIPLFRRESRPTGAYLLWMAVTPIALTYLLTLYGAHLFVERYMYFTLPLWCVLFAAGVRAIPHRLASALAAIALLAFAARTTALKRPFPEAVALDRAGEWIAARMAPGDPVFCADTHSLFTFHHRHPEQPVRLLMQWRVLPYFEGADFVPAAWRVPPESLATVAREGRRWWGLRTRHGGIPSAAGAALMDSLAGRARTQIDMVTIWEGGARPAAPLPGAAPPDPPRP